MTGEEKKPDPDLLEVFDGGEVMKALWNAINWAPCDGYPEDTCRCRCGAIFRSHVKALNGPKGFMMMSRKPCPACGRRDYLKEARGEPEQWTIGR